MKSKKIIIILFVLLLGLVVWWKVPTCIINISTDKVSKIEVFTGFSGEDITITDRDHIEYIISNLKSIKVKKEKISISYTGYSYRITIYNTKGRVYKSFIINSESTIRKDPFFYIDETGSIDIDYYERFLDNE